MYVHENITAALKYAAYAILMSSSALDNVKIKR